MTSKAALNRQIQVLERRLRQEELMRFHAENRQMELARELGTAQAIADNLRRRLEARERQDRRRWWRRLVRWLGRPASESAG